MLPLSVQKLDKKKNERYQRITQALNIFEISDKYPSDISGGATKNIRPCIYYAS